MPTELLRTSSKPAVIPWFSSCEPGGWKLGRCPELPGSQLLHRGLTTGSLLARSSSTAVSASSTHMCLGWHAKALLRIVDGCLQHALTQTCGSLVQKVCCKAECDKLTDPATCCCAGVGPAV